VRRAPTGTPVEWVEEESYFFRLSQYQKKLLDLYESQPDFMLPRERLNEVASFVRGGLQDLSISRTTFDWGIPVPGDPRHIMYVWVDALTNYITAVGFPDTEGAMFKRWWPCDLHVIGKDIVRFHAVYWPAFLMSAGLPIPRHIFSHGFLFNRGEKMSKSVGNVVDPFALADAYGVDPLRFFLMREVPFGQDGSYSHEAIVNRTNADLANDLGNLAQRSLTMVAKTFGGVLPAPGALSANDTAMLAAADAMIGKAREAMKTRALHQVLNAAWAVVADANRYFAGEAPWALAKTDPVRQGTVLHTTAEVIRQVAILSQPFMPKSAGKLLDLLAVPEAERDFAALGGGRRIAAGAALPAPTPVFPRWEAEESKTPAGPRAGTKGPARSKGDLKAPAEAITSRAAENDAHSEMAEPKGGPGSDHDHFFLQHQQIVKARAGAYRSHRVVGRGGNGTTFLALGIDGPHIGLQFALKVFHKISNEQRRSAFLKEIEHYKTLDHPAIIRFHDDGEYRVGDRVYPFVLVEYVPRTLKRLLLENSHRIDRVAGLRFIIGVASALKYLHELPTPLIHRDIKPDNILISGEKARLADFGLVKSLEEATLDEPLAKDEVAYAAMPRRYRTPELVQRARGDKKPLTSASDIFQLGTVLYEVVTGFNPQLFPQNLTDEIKLDIREIPGESGDQLCKLVQAMLAGEASARPSASGVLRDLLQIHRDYCSRMKEVTGQFI
jgi:methionyl-tRNA synthetase